MSRVTLSPHKEDYGRKRGRSSEFLKSSDWIKENHPENGLFKVYWKDVEWRSRGGATFNANESNCRIHTDCSGHLRWEWYYKDGEMVDGISRGWWSDGTLKQERNWKNGKQNGLFKEYNEAGIKVREGTWKDGKKDGLVTLWYPNGQKEAEVTYKNGKEEGRKLCHT